MNNRKLVLICHEESEWSKQNLFAGWTDVDLSEQGRKEAGFDFDICFAFLFKEGNACIKFCIKKGQGGNGCRL